MRSERALERSLRAQQLISECLLRTRSTAVAARTLGSAIVWWIVLVVVAVVLIATYVTWTASRVDRLHARAAAAQSALDAHLVRRAAAATQLGETLGRSDLHKLSRAALEAPAEERELAENDL